MENENLPELLNLDELITTCRKNYNELPYKGDIRIDEELSILIKQYFEDKNTNISVFPFSITLVNNENLKAFIPSTWLWIANCFAPLAQAFQKYEKTLKTVRDYLKQNEPTFVDKEYKEFLKNLPLSGVSEKFDVIFVETDYKEEINKAIDQKFKNTELFDLIKKYQSLFDNAIGQLLSQKSTDEQENFLRFVYDRNWWIRGVGKSLERGDCCESSFLLASQMIVANSAKLYALTLCFAQHKDLVEAFENLPKNPELFSSISVQSTLPQLPANTSDRIGVNKIFYGAPGTGKSYEIEKLTNQENSKRIVFHPETQYSDFIGCLKPSMGKDGIEYSFKPGPFIQIIVDALNNPDHHYYLVIEELNRAPAAAVFGDIFQLLDRNEYGESCYPIAISDNDLLTFINQELNKNAQIQNRQLKIPANLSLFATMNSSDQAVMPLDTAFKRRWQFVYKKIDFTHAPVGSFPLSLRESTQSVLWSLLAQSINKILSLNSIPEDRHLGPWYVNSYEIEDQSKAKQTLTGKIFLYLWDDVLRHGRTHLIFDSNIKNYGTLITEFENGKSIFSTELTELLLQKIPNIAENSSVKGLNNEE
ncbi:AAA family ATPase [Acinetobacter bereziniae]|uniref:McrB family protein n=1 Tax=Acinetobacter bereziniae TaxID=106648 RepID=UPI0032133C80